MDEAAPTLLKGTHSTVLLQGTSSICFDIGKRVDHICEQRYLTIRDDYRTSDIANPRPPRWVGTSSAFASAIWRASGDSMNVCAFKVRLAWDKHYTGRHKNLGQRYDEETQRCPNCELADETQDHILRHCTNLAFVAIRTVAFRCQGGRIRALYLKDPATARYIEEYHNLCLTHEEGGSMITGMLSPAVLVRVSMIRQPRRDEEHLFRALVDFCRGYCEMSMDIYRARAQLLAEKEAHFMLITLGLECL